MRLIQSDYLLRTVYRFLGFIFVLGSAAATHAIVPLDYDGDGKSDLVLNRFDSSTPNFVWHILKSQDGYSAITFGLQANDAEIYDADFDGDGKNDIAMTRFVIGETYKYWWILNSSDSTVNVRQFGLNEGDIPMPQDYDGDGITDLCVRRSGVWWIQQSSDGAIRAEPFGDPNNSELLGGDYDGDGKADLAVTRGLPAQFPGGPSPAFLYIKRSTDGNWDVYEVGDSRSTGFLTGDYDGDGISDVAVWQGNLWLWIRSSDSQLEGVRFGDPITDEPASGDYDGDGKTDPAIWRRPNALRPHGEFHILGSTEGYKVIQFGIQGDQSAGHQGSRRYIRAVGF